MARRLNIHLLRITSDIVKAAVLLVVFCLGAYFGSMPFWPLAVPPVSAELKAKYPVPEFHPRGNGEAERLWFNLYPMPAAAMEEPPEVLETPLYKLIQVLDDTEVEKKWDDEDWTQVRAWLADIEPQIHAMAGACAVEVPPEVPVTGNPMDPLPAFRPMIRLFKYLPGLHVSDKNSDALMRGVRAASQISTYYTRSGRLIDVLVGNLLAEQLLTTAVVPMYAAGQIDEKTAKELELIFEGWQEQRGTMVRSTLRENNHMNRLVETLWRKQPVIEPEWLHDPQIRRELGISRGMANLRFWGWMIGQDYTSVRKAGDNRQDRLMIEAVAWSDPKVERPDDVSAQLLGFESESSFFRRGVLAATLMPDFSSFYRRYYSTDAMHRIGHAVAAIGAYRKTNGALPKSLEEAYDAAGLKHELQTRYVYRQPEYQVLAGGGTNDVEVEAFTLTVWGDGSRCIQDGGVSWLVVRNPAFGEQLVRVWSWEVLSESAAGKVDNHEVRLVDNAPQAYELRHPALGVPAALLSEDTDKVKEAVEVVKQLGWVESPIFPRISIKD